MFGQINEYATLTVLTKHYILYYILSVPSGSLT